MKIALAHKKYTTHGGTERDVVNLSNFLAKEGHTTHVFTGSWDKEVADKRIIFHQISAWGKSIGIDKYIFAKNLENEINKFDFDIVQTFSRVGFGDVIRVGGGCHQVYVEKMIKNLHTPVKKYLERFRRKFSLNDYLTRYYERKDFQPDNYKKIIVISKAIKEEIMDIYNVPEKDIVVNYSGVDVKKFNINNRKKFRLKYRDKYDLDRDDIALLFVGTGFKRKGLKYIIEALPELPKKVKLLVVGKGNIKRYKRNAQVLEVLDRIIFVGASSNVEAYYALADIFVLPTIYEPFGLVISEALASGLPVITTAVAGAAEIIEEGKEGFILEQPDAVNELVYFIKRLLNNEVRKKMSEEARGKALQYSLKQKHKNILKIYKDILKSN